LGRERQQLVAVLVPHQVMPQRRYSCSLHVDAMRFGQSHRFDLDSQDVVTQGLRQRIDRPSQLPFNFGLRDHAR
jgi:hypothetical protein